MNTKQQVFDTVVDHLFAQGRPAKQKRPNDDGEKCLYRTDDGLKCAVGCLIPDEMYRSYIEDKSVGALVRNRYELPAEIAAYTEMLSDLQYTHDSCLTMGDGTFDLGDLDRQLNRRAEQHDVEYTSRLAA